MPFVCSSCILTGNLNSWSFGSICFGMEVSYKLFRWITPFLVQC